MHLLSVYDKCTKKKKKHTTKFEIITTKNNKNRESKRTCRGASFDFLLGMSEEKPDRKIIHGETESLLKDSI